MIARVAMPEPFKAAVPRIVLPFAKVTLPDGMPVPLLSVTVAVKVTLPPRVILVAEAVRAVAVVAEVTVIATAAEAEVANEVLPEYAAVIEAAPIGRVVDVRVATPALSSVAVPSVVEPLEKVTVPDGVPTPEVAATVAVRVTLAPKGEL